MDNFIIHNGTRYPCGPGANLSGFPLYEIDLSELDLRGANFTGTNVYNSTLDRANLEEAKFIRARLFGTSVTNAKMKGADFNDGIDIQDVDFQGSDLRQCSIGNTDFSGVNLTDSITIGFDINTANHPNAERIIDTTEKLHQRIIQAEQVAPIYLDAAIDIANHADEYDITPETKQFFNNIQKAKELSSLRATSKYFAGKTPDSPIGLLEGVHEKINDYIGGEGITLQRINAIMEQGGENATFLQRLSEEETPQRDR